MPWWGYMLMLLCLLLGGAAGYLLYRKHVQATIHSTEEYAKRLREEATQRADEYKREKLAEAREEILREKAQLDRTREENEQVLRERREECRRAENRLETREQQIAARETQLDTREQMLDKKSATLDTREEQLTARSERLLAAEQECDKRRKALDEAEASIDSKLQAEMERVAAMTQDEARRALTERICQDAYREAAKEVQEIETRAREDCDRKAREILATVIQRCAADYVAEYTVTSVSLPNDDIKGRIIGREGRNIRALESKAGVDLIIDDTPDTIVISGHSPIRREIARLALERLIADGRINVARIEEALAKAEETVNAACQEAGDSAVFETGVQGLHPELIATLGQLRYRTSFGQNVLKHSLEVSYLAGMMAAELGANVQLAKRAGLLHDIGKALDHEQEGSHVDLGAEYARKFHESDDVIHCIRAHHNDIEPQTVEAVLVQAADTISAARPGARRESMELYIKRMTQLEEIGNSFRGVEKCFAIQSGREIRVMVKPEDITDVGTHVMAREIAARIANEMQFPGQIRVNVIRETRVTEMAVNPRKKTSD